MKPTTWHLWVCSNATTPHTCCYVATSTWSAYYARMVAADVLGSPMSTIQAILQEARAVVHVRQEPQEAREYGTPSSSGLGARRGHQATQLHPGDEEHNHVIDNRYVVHFYGKTAAGVFERWTDALYRPEAKKVRK